jgi:ABC-type phosphate transport system substrate-binding protein
MNNSLIKMVLRGRVGVLSMSALVASQVLLGPALSGSVSANESLLGGRAFSPPSETIPMGDTWEAKGITHTTDTEVDLAVVLDQQLYPAMGPMVEAFAKERGVKIAVQEGTCGVSAGVLANKTADMGGFCCAPTVTDRLPGLTYHTVGIGALALITHPSNPVSAVSLDEARALFGSNIRDWSELPMSGMKLGASEKVRAVARLHCKIRPGHWRLILDTEQQFGWNITEVSAIKDMISQVSSMPGSIGYETLWHIDHKGQQDNQPLKTLLVNDTDPRDLSAVATGKYPLYRVFNITSWGSGPAQSKLGTELAAYLVEHASQLDAKFAIIPAQDLRKNGWQFDGDELIGEPK